MEFSRRIMNVVLIAALAPAAAAAQTCLYGVCATSYDGPAVPQPAGIEADFPQDAASRAPEGSLFNSTFRWERNQAAAPTWDLQRAGCGLIAAEALLRFFKKDPGLDKIVEIKNTALKNGWWLAPGGPLSAGMTDRNAEKNLVERLFRDNGVNVQVDLIPHTDFAADSRLIRESLDRGKPVIINTSAHYFFAEGYDNNGNLFVGYTGTIKTGQAHMRLENISGSSGGVINFIVPR